MATAVLVGCIAGGGVDRAGTASAGVVIAATPSSPGAGPATTTVRPRPAGMGRTAAGAAHAAPADRAAGADDAPHHGPLALLMGGPELPLELDRCSDARPFANRPRTFAFAVRDGEDGTAGGLPAGTSITFATTNGTIVGHAAYAVPDSTEPASTWVYPVTVRSDAVQGAGGACTDKAREGQLNVRIETPLGVVTDQSFPVAD